MPAQIILDQQTFKALAAPTRINILKLLRTRRHMQTELAQQLNLAVPTVKEHLLALEAAELVEMQDDGHKWKYYSLTRKGKSILEPREEQQQMWIALGVFVAVVIGGIIGWIREFRLLESTQFSTTVGSQMEGVSAPLATPNAAKALSTIAVQPGTTSDTATTLLQNTSWTWYLIILVIITVWLVVTLIRNWKAKR